MSDAPTDRPSKVKQDSQIPQERLVYVVPQADMPQADGGEISLIELWQVLWGGKWIIISVTALFGILSVFYALSATEWYRADVLLMSAEEKQAPNVVGQLGGLASLAGVRIGGSESNEALAVLGSRDFTRAFIEAEGLLPMLFADQWDEEAGRWQSENPGEWPDMRDAVRIFDEKIRRIRQDTTTGLISLSIEWTDPETAAAWTNRLVARLNEHMRQRALVEAETNVAYLQSQLASTSILTLQQSISRLLEVEMQKLMLARGSEEYAFRVIDRAEPPIFRSRPWRTLLVAAGVGLGALLSVFMVFVRRVLTNERTTTKTVA